MTVTTSVDAAGVLPRYMRGVTDDEFHEIHELVETWWHKYRRNELRSAYYDMRMLPHYAGIIPQQAFARLSAVTGWAAKAVHALAQRNIFDGFVSPGQDQDPFELASLLEANRFDLELPQAIVSAYKHSCSFITTTLGDPAAGDPDVVVVARSALWSAARWDQRRRAVSSALAITDVDDGRPTEMTVYLPDVVLTCELNDDDGVWDAYRQPNPLGEVLVEPLTSDPQIDRPFGHSRINRAVMSIIDRAILTILRTEVSAEFYAAPRMLALGVAEDAFTKGKWAAAIDRWFAITRDEDGELPTVTQLPQMTMQPLVDLYRMYASQFAAETGLPISALGIVQDNPPSAEALYAAERDLIVEARAQNAVLGGALQRVARRVVMLRDGLTEPTPELMALRANWANPAFTSPVTAADALVKLSTVFPWLGETEVALEYAGFSHPEITRLLADKQRAAAGSLLDRVLATTPTTNPPAGPVTPPAGATT
jgi:hypothetical protein